MTTTSTKRSEGYSTSIKFRDYDVERLVGMAPTKRSFTDSSTGRENSYHSMPLKYKHLYNDKEIMDDGIIIGPEMEAPLGVTKEEFNGEKGKSKTKGKSKAPVKKRPDQYQVGFVINTAISDQAEFKEFCVRLYYRGGKLVEENDVALNQGGFETPAIDAKKKPVYKGITHIKRDEKNMVVPGYPWTLYAPLDTSKRTPTRFLDLNGKSIPWEDLLDVPFKGIPFVHPVDMYAGNGIKIRTKLMKVIVTHISSDQPTEVDNEVINEYKAANPGAQEVQSERLAQIRAAKAQMTPANTTTSSGGVIVKDLTKAEEPEEPKTPKDDDGDDSESEDDRGSDQSGEHDNSDSDDQGASEAVSKMTINSKSANHTHVRGKPDLKTLTNGGSEVSRSPSQSKVVRISKK